MSTADAPVLRERRKDQDKGPSETKVKRTESKINEILAEEDSGFSLVDALRGVVFVVLIAGVLGYFVAGENGVWNQYRPRWTRADVVKGWFVCLRFLLFLSTIITFTREAMRYMEMFLC